MPAWHYARTPIKGLSLFYVYTWDCRASPKDDTSLDARAESPQGFVYCSCLSTYAGYGSHSLPAGPPQFLAQRLL
jgi:hypothetical protein